MNTAVRTIQDTPMAPYAGMMKSMEPSDMQAVILFLQDAMREAEETKRKADDEFLAKKLAEIKVDPDMDELVDWLRLTPEEAADERTRWILGLDREMKAFLDTNILVTNNTKDFQEFCQLPCLSSHDFLVTIFRQH